MDMIAETLRFTDVTHYRAAATRGATLLDACNPGWHREINLDTLNLNDARLCILGQLYGYYVDGFQRLDHYTRAHGGIDDDVSMVSHGFAAEDESLIRREWVTLINERRQADALNAARDAMREVAETLTVTEKETVGALS